MHTTAIIKLKGGMGNQMFQYAFSRALIAAAKERGDSIDVTYDITGYSEGERIKKDTLRTFDLSKLSCEIKLADEDTVLKTRYPYGRISKLIRRVIHKFFIPYIWHYNETLLAPPYKNYYEGYWQTEKYFKNIEAEIRKHFAFKNLLNPTADEMRKRIEQDEHAVGVFFRRTDYVGHGDLDVCDEVYYIRALATMKELVPNMQLYVMSDDIEWVKANGKLPANAVYVSSPHISYIEELELATACRHHIIPNSTFAWWGAWLNTHPEKIIIAPRRWSKKYNDTYFKDIAPINWIRI